jgi:hypothetical protein
MGFSDFCFHAEANLFTSVAFSKGGLAAVQKVIFAFGAP